jgi:hypothetical protein
MSFRESFMLFGPRAVSPGVFKIHFDTEGRTRGGVRSPSQFPNPYGTFLLKTSQVRFFVCFMPGTLLQ